MPDGGFTSRPVAKTRKINPPNAQDEIRESLQILDGYKLKVEQAKIKLGSNTDPEWSDEIWLQL
jgi:hypothetical protein